eukprot:scaffold412_cov311-Pavlova_lutheri.AAC.42
MSFELPRAKVGEAGWALKRFLSCSREGGVLRLPSKRDTARKLPVVFKSSWRVKNGAPSSWERRRGSR